ncbi:MAG: DUF1566 domain-containing protein [Beijerinckiaceae bacterium]
MHRTFAVLGISLALFAGAAASALGACEPAGDGANSVRFAVSDAEVRDSRTGLIWRRCSLGLEWKGGACRGEMLRLSLEEAKKAAAALGAGWRVPTADELFGLVDRTCGEPALDVAAFPDVRASRTGELDGAMYWTVTPLGGIYKGLYVTVDFTTGDYDGHSTGLFYAVRPVRSP